MKLIQLEGKQLHVRLRLNASMLRFYCTAGTLNSDFCSILERMHCFKI